MHTRTATALLVAAVFGSTAALTAQAAEVKQPANVSESAPARTGPASTPTGSSGTAGTSVKPQTPSAVNESAPARTGAATTPTGSSGGSTSGEMSRLPKTPGSVSESAPARTGPATTPTGGERAKPKKSSKSAAARFQAADKDGDGKLDMAEFEQAMKRKK